MEENKKEIMSAENEVSVEGLEQTTGGYDPYDQNDPWNDIQDIIKVTELKCPVCGSKNLTITQVDYYSIVKCRCGWQEKYVALHTK